MELDVKKPDYLAINPNGRLPAIYDPNTDLTLWESGAIIEYLIERYDVTHNLSFASGTAESYHAKQWLFFQTTGQGPYYGQAAWYKRFDPEQLPSAIERYTKEINRVAGVFEGHLAKQKVVITKFVGRDEYNLDDFLHVKQWLSKLTSRKSVKVVMEI
ncbi:glutathione S-transferase Ure2-like protein [Lipomyces orientalis]|uniref:Glutathione S-transferase Ure2-like protein n=1 Tax=Lipomyces orientalis TaxID=1233043 RepID=A0ACC3TS59_9ASCO